MPFPIRSPRTRTGGIFLLARIIDKIRLDAANQLPLGYHVGLIPGNRTFDDRLCRFLNLDWDDLKSRVLLGGTDDEILAWAFAHGRQPDAEQIEVWNTFMEKRGWRDSASPGFAKNKADSDFADRDDIQTYFDLMDAEEGHAP
jgi:gluconokinase